MPKIPILYACCILVRGSNRSLICDTQRQKYYMIPNSLYEILKDYKYKSIVDIKKMYDNKYNDTIDEYFEFLEREDLLFFTESPMDFPDIDLKWNIPSVIHDAIIDIGENFSLLDFEKIILGLDSFGCKHIQVRSFFEKNIDFFYNILNVLEMKRIHTVDLTAKYTVGLNKKSLTQLCNKFPRIHLLYIHSHHKTTILKSGKRDTGHIFTTTQKINNNNHCGIISPEYFTVNIKTFTEAQKHNTCLNRKISIDTEGYIRNCPSMKEHYGNIKDTTLQEALQHPDFKKYWFVNKDQISVCKDCEFRYICTDCRAYIENPEDMYSKPLKCGYNPYTCEWEEWSTNPLKQKAIEHYGMREMVGEG